MLRINVPLAVRRGVVGSIPVNIADYVGGTPIVQLTRMVGPDAARTRSAETHDRAAAVEDRAALFFQRSGDAEREDAHRAAAQRHRESAAADRAKRSA